jgi:hypothetical protein
VADTCTERTPGTFLSALVTRFSQDVHVIPEMGTVSDETAATLVLVPTVFLPLCLEVPMIPFDPGG